MSENQGGSPLDLFGQLQPNGGGWDWINQATEQPDPIEQERAAQEIYDLNVAIRNTFNTPDGRRCLEWLQTLAVDGARVTASEIMQNPAGAEKLMLLREGQAALYFEITRRIVQAELGPPAVNKPEAE